MMKWYRLIASVTIFLLAACSTPPTREPAPVIESEKQSATSTETDSEASSGVVVRAYESPQKIIVTPTHSPAVEALLAHAEADQRRGDTIAAVSNLERALRIEPRNADLWQRLAVLRLRQGKYQMAEDLAGKSTRLAGGDIELKRANWNLIAQARRARGDESGARVAERKARMLY